MRKGIQVTLKNASKILHELSKQPISRTMLERFAVCEGETHGSFEHTIRFLTNEGFVKKVGAGCRAPYMITEKGVKLLEALT